MYLHLQFLILRKEGYDITQCKNLDSKSPVSLLLTRWLWTRTSQRLIASKRRIIIKLPIQGSWGSNEIINVNAEGTVLNTQLLLDKHQLNRQPRLLWHGRLLKCLRWIYGVVFLQNPNLLGKVVHHNPLSLSPDSLNCFGLDSLPQSEETSFFARSERFPQEGSHSHGPLPIHQAAIATAIVRDCGPPLGLPILPSINSAVIKLEFECLIPCPFLLDLCLPSLPLLFKSSCPLPPLLTKTCVLHPWCPSG